MTLFQLFIPIECSRRVVYRMGDLNMVEFRDLNKNRIMNDRPFIEELKRMDKLLKNYVFFKKEIAEQEIEIKKQIYVIDRIPLESEIKKYEEDTEIEIKNIQEIKTKVREFTKKKNELIYKLSVVRMVNDFFSLGNSGTISCLNTSFSTDFFSDERQEFSIKNFFLAGLIDRSNLFVFHKIVWRFLRGNLYFHHSEFKARSYDPEGIVKSKSFFLIFFYGNSIQKYICEICTSLKGTIYEIDYDTAMRKKKIDQLDIDLSNVVKLIHEFKNTLYLELKIISRRIEEDWENISKEKKIYEMLNKFDYGTSKKSIIAEGWIPTNKIEILMSQICDCKNSQLPPTILNILKTKLKPPTHFSQNKITSAFQDICDAYSIPAYQEANPCLLTIVTFPLMFAIMFGDLGHGLILFLISLYLVFNEKSLLELKKNEVLNIVYNGRYVLLLMGFFSIFMGLLYNDVFSKPMSIFTSGWSWENKIGTADQISAKNVGVYIFGIDPAWHGSQNSLIFLNSYKMKLSIIVGFFHMLYSFCLSLANHIHNNNVLDIFANFIPGLFFMLSLFGYLSFCIIYKWSVDWSQSDSTPPSLLNLLINMVLNPSKIDNPLYKNQHLVQKILLLISIICVPLLFLVKPLYLIYSSYNVSPVYSELSQSDDPILVQHSDHELIEKKSITDIFVSQSIHTIEFCLNCVSHTASYLRLWALSLAHSQLSSVLWSMTLDNAFKHTGFFGVISVFFFFFIWFVLTITILIFMEGLSALLHSLRLHWVESMSKYFTGDGYIFNPFNFHDTVISY